MTRAMAHRGPDDSGHVLLPTHAPGMMAGLGHRRLSIIDLEGGHQPMWSVDRRYAIVFNGEIYNYREVRGRLQAMGCQFATQSDTEVILQAYACWGEAGVERLEGMFAFGIWEPATETWFLARDRFGIKPLYWAQPEPGTLAFASEIKPLLPLMGGARVERGALYHYLLYGWGPVDRTIFQGVQHLPPSHTLTLRAGDAAPRIRRYWQLARAGVHRSPAAWADAARAALDAAVASHLVADVPVGLTLSGGVDSSAVLAAMARAVSPACIHAFTLGYGLPDDEVPFARLAAHHVGAMAVERQVPVDSFAERFATCIWHLEEPIAHPVMGTTYQLAGLVREQVKVTLIGEGADELFAGYPHYRLLRPPFSLLPRSRLWPTILAAAYLMPEVSTLARLLAPDLVDRGLLDAVAHQYDAYAKEGDVPSGVLRFELEHELPQSQLARIDKLTMAGSVEARVPFLDRAFAELAYDAPFGLKVQGGTQKALLRRAVADRLPPAIVQRPKSGKRGTQALLPTILGMVTDGPLSHLIAGPTLTRRGWFDAAAVRRYLGEAGHPVIRRHPVESRRRAKFALALAVLEQWAGLFLDQTPAERIYE